MPVIESGQYLIDTWVEIGLSNQDKSPISWAEINAYKQANNPQLNAQEQNVIRKLSREYCNQYHESSYESESNAPYISTEAQAAIDAKHRGRK